VDTTIGHFRHWVRDNEYPSLNIMYDFLFMQYDESLSRNYLGLRKKTDPYKPVVWELHVEVRLFTGNLTVSSRERTQSGSKGFLGAEHRGVTHSWFDPNYPHSPNDEYQYETCGLIHQLSRLETVSTYQWTGSQPIEHSEGPLNGPLEVVWREPPKWDVSAVNLTTSQRHLFLRGHVARDYAGMIQLRLQALIDYGLMLTEGFEGLIDENAHLGDLYKVEDLPSDQQDVGREYLTVISERLQHNPPPWKWPQVDFARR